MLFAGAAWAQPPGTAKPKALGLTAQEEKLVVLYEDDLFERAPAHFGAICRTLLDETVMAKLRMSSGAALAGRMHQLLRENATVVLARVEDLLRQKVPSEQINAEIGKLLDKLADRMGTESVLLLESKIPRDKLRRIYREAFHECPIESVLWEPSVRELCLTGLQQARIGEVIRDFKKDRSAARDPQRFDPFSKTDRTNAEEHDQRFLADANAKILAILDENQKLIYDVVFGQ